MILAILIFLPILILYFKLIYKVMKWVDFVIVGGFTWWGLATHFGLHNAFALAGTLFALIIWSVLTFTWKPLAMVIAVVSSAFSALIVFIVVKEMDTEWQIVITAISFIVFLSGRIRGFIEMQEKSS